ncbi:MAG: phosphoglycerate kinase [bacterium]|nr:phosphoglycerate kinase [bacterium]
MIKLKSIKETDVANKHVIVRCGFDVPFGDKGEIVNDERIVECLSTIKYLIDQNAKVILISHNGRPKGKIVPKLSMDKVAERLEKLLDIKVIKLNDCIGQEVRDAVAKLEEGQVMLLENLRFHIEEEAGDKNFAKEISMLGEIYVNESFATSHRKHASMTGIPMYLPSFAGFRLEKEIEILSSALQEPKRPLVAVIGGAKISDKMKVIKKFLKIADHVIVGGALANTILKAKGIAIGKSIVEDEMIDFAKELLLTDTNFHLPVDVIVASRIDKDAATEMKAVGNVAEHEYILDIGPDTIKLYNNIIKEAQTIIWGGPMGFFEYKAFAQGTNDIANAIADSEALSIVGGGDTMDALKKAGCKDKIDFISTGGGAMLKYLESMTLPAVEPLIKR